MGLTPYIKNSVNICGKLAIADESTFDQKSLESGIYKCTNSLFDVRQGGAKCIPTSACDGYWHT